MTTTSLHQLESALGIQLPQEYVEAMQRYPFAGEHIGTDMLMDDVRALNVSNRRSDVEKRKKKQAAPDPTEGFFCIGSDGSELTFFIKPGRDSRGVWYYDVETGDFKKYCDTLQDYIEKCRRIDAEEERLPNETSDWPEWKKNLYVLGLLIGFLLFGYAVFRAARWILRLSGSI